MRIRIPSPGNYLDGMIMMMSCIGVRWSAGEVRHLLQRGGVHEQRGGGPPATTQEIHHGDRQGYLPRTQQVGFCVRYY